MTSASTPAIADFNAQSYFQAQPPEDTKDFVFQQTMIRCKNPKLSLDFYTQALGFKLIMFRDFPQWGFSVYFLAPGQNLKSGKDPAALSEEERWALCMRTPGCLELTWNHGSEQEAGEGEGPNKGRLYNTGNADTVGSGDGGKVKGGWGHLGVTVPDVYAACERFQKLGVEFHKSPNQGGMKGLAFIKDPDGYLVEVLPQGPMVSQPVDCLGAKADEGGYADNAK